MKDEIKNGLSIGSRIDAIYNDVQVIKNVLGGSKLKETGLLEQFSDLKKDYYDEKVNCQNKIIQMQIEVAAYNEELKDYKTTTRWLIGIIVTIYGIILGWIGFK